MYCLLPSTLVMTKLSERGFALPDYALFAANAQIGATPSANQLGSFLNKSYWLFNARHIDAPAFASFITEKFSKAQGLLKINSANRMIRMLRDTRINSINKKNVINLTVDGNPVLTSIIFDASVMP
jgi:hypothetical protein